MNFTKGSEKHNTSLDMNSSATEEISKWLPLEIIYLVLTDILILFGNCLVILAFVKGHRSIRTYTNYYVVNLAISDLLVGCSSLPYWMSIRAGFHDETLDTYFFSLDLLFGTTSILSLAVISLERMYAVKFPVRHRNLSRPLVYVSIASVWGMSISLTIMNAILQKKGKGSKMDKNSAYGHFIAAFVLPSIVIIGSYVILFVTAAKMTRADNERKSIKKEMRIAKTISMIIGLFVVFWTPFFAVNISYACCLENMNQDDLPSFINISKALHYSNSMMNFFVYAVRSPDFRETFKTLLFNKCNTIEIRERVRLLSTSFVHQRNRNNNNNTDELLKKKNEINIQETSNPCRDANEKL